MGITLITGAGGLLGSQVARAFTELGEEVRTFTREQLDVSDGRAVLRAVGSVRPNLIVHCAAMTNVDTCEEQPERAIAVNFTGSGNVAKAATEFGADVVAVSTDYVFDGTKGSPYEESDQPNPIQTYGVTKLEGEGLVRSMSSRHYIVRSAWIYGRGGKNFLSQLPALASSGRPIKAVVDQRGSPTFAPDLARAIGDLVQTGAYGTYHVTNDGACTFSEFCRYALAVIGADADITDVKLADLGRPARRPPDTSLVGPALEAAGIARLRPWQEAAEAFCAGWQTAR